MNQDEVRAILQRCLRLEPRKLDPPTDADWRDLETRLDTTFPPSFRAFIDSMHELAFPGDILNVPSHGRNNGNDTITAVYESEVALGLPPEYVTFYAIGNGDYFLLRCNREGDSTVYYWRHEEMCAEMYSESFDAWLRGLESFLRGA